MKLILIGFPGVFMVYLIVTYIPLDMVRPYVNFSGFILMCLVFGMAYEVIKDLL